MQFWKTFDSFFRNISCNNRFLKFHFESSMESLPDKCNMSDVSSEKDEYLQHSEALAREEEYGEEYGTDFDGNNSPYESITPDFGEWVEEKALLQFFKLFIQQITFFEKSIWVCSQSWRFFEYRATKFLSEYFWLRSSTNRSRSREKCNFFLNDMLFFFFF